MNEQRVLEILTNRESLPALLFAYSVQPRAFEIKPGNEDYVKLTRAKPVLGFRLTDDKLFPQDYSFGNNISVIPYSILEKEEISIEDLEIEPNKKDLITIVGLYDKNTIIEPANLKLGDVIKLSNSSASFSQDFPLALEYLKSDFLNQLKIAGVVRSYNDRALPDEKDLTSKLYYSPVLRD